MKADDKKKLREFLEDPARMPADLLASLTGEEARDARRHQELDRKLRQAFGELGGALEKKAPAAGEQEFKARLLGAINARKSTPPVGELAYMRKVRMRQIINYATDRPAYSFGAVAALLVLAFLPFFFQSQSADQNLAHNDAAAPDDRLGSAPPAVAASESQEKPSQALPAPRLKQQAPAPASTSRQELAGADKRPAPPEAAKPAAKPAEEVAVNMEAPSFRSRSAIVPESAAQDQDQAGKPAAPAPSVDARFQVRERILTQKVQMARDKTAKIKALRDLETFYRQQGQAARAQDVQRQIQQLQ